MAEKRLGRFREFTVAGCFLSGPDENSEAVPVAWEFRTHRSAYLPEEIVEPENQIGLCIILIGASYPNSLCEQLHPRVSALHDCSGVEMPLSPLVSAEVPAVSVAVQDPLIGPAQPFSSLAIHLAELVPEQKRSEARPTGSSAPRDTTDCTSETK
jgi:hypothetical protein